MIYTIQYGDNLTRIARAHNTTVQNLLKLNPELKDHPNTIFAGSNLKISDESQDERNKAIIKAQNDSIKTLRDSLASQQKAQVKNAHNNENIEQAKADYNKNSATQQNTSIGAILTLGAKSYLKRKQIKTIKPDATKQAKKAKIYVKKQYKNAKGKVLKAKAQHVRNSAAYKLRQARKSQAEFVAGKEKLAELKKARLSARKDLATKQSKYRKAPMEKANKQNMKNAQKEFEKLNKKLEKTKVSVKNAKTKSETAKSVAKAAKKKVTKAVNKAAGKGITKAATKTAAKTTAKAAGKTIIKKVPLLGLAAGVFFAADRIMHGDLLGAGMEVVSGAASIVPGFGTALSVAVDAGLAAKDLHDSNII